MGKKMILDYFQGVWNRSWINSTTLCKVIFTAAATTQRFCSSAY
jgi:hypothetical protein